MSHDQKHPEVFSNAVVAQQALDAASAWQVCPLCIGRGTVHSHTSTTSLTSVTCSVCSGFKIINKTTGLPPGFHNAQKPNISPASSTSPIFGILLHHQGTL